MGCRGGKLAERDNWQSDVNTIITIIIIQRRPCRFIHTPITTVTAFVQFFFIIFVFFALLYLHTLEDHRTVFIVTIVCTRRGYFFFFFFRNYRENVSK